MNDDTTMAERARQLQAAQDGVQQIVPFSAQAGGLDLPSAYELAELVHQARLHAGAQAVGRKIGFTNPALWDQYGVRQPMWGWMYASTVSHARAQRAACSLARFAEPRIEPEIVLHFHKTPPVAAAGAPDLAAILDCIDWVAHGFEIVQSHYPGWKFQAADTVADGGLHGGLVLGEAVPVHSLGAQAQAALRDFSIALHRDGALHDSGRGSNVLGSPLAAVAHLIQVLADRPGALPIQAGEIITTGTLTSAWPVASGQRWHTVIDGIDLPGLTLDFVA